MNSTQSKAEQYLEKSKEKREAEARVSALTRFLHDEAQFYMHDETVKMLKMELQQQRDERDGIHMATSALWKIMTAEEQTEARNLHYKRSKK